MLPGMSVVRQAPFCKLNGRSGRVVQVLDAMLYSTFPLGFALPPIIKSLLSSTLTKQALFKYTHYTLPFMKYCSYCCWIYGVDRALHRRNLAYPEVPAGMLEIVDHLPFEYISAELSGRLSRSSPPAMIRSLPLE